MPFLAVLFDRPSVNRWMIDITLQLGRRMNNPCATREHVHGHAKGAFGVEAHV
jgi:hypothetical protein